MTIEYRVEGGVGIFTIDNGRLNVFTMAMHEQLHRDYLKFLNDDQVKVGIIVGAGENFCAGDDLKESDTPIKSRSNPRWDEITMMHRRTKPMIAAVDGWCLGQGMMYLMLLTDIRVASPEARFGFPEIAYGMGGAGGATRLGLQMAPVHAAYLALTGEKVSAQYALDINLINEVVAGNEVFNRAMAIAQSIAQHPLIGIQTELEGLHKGTELSRQDALNYSLGQYITQRKLHRAEHGEAIDTMKKITGEQK
jgi:enoyl-CoA hydratase/carnithine racemase